MIANIRKTVLVVDDTVSNIEILNEVLSREYEILFATNGIDAIEIAGEQLPDLILLDVVMPEIDGYEVCSRLKAEEKTRDIPIIFVTAMDQEEDESRGFNAGVVDYITKPIRPAIVTARVHNHLELKCYQDSLKTLSTIDGLTGIPNRHYFDEVLEREWLRGKREQTLISLILMDIDYFKDYNDHYGHLAGDQCLRRLAKALADVGRRPADFLSRYGGEEFTLILPDTDPKGALFLVDRIMERVRDLNIPHAYSQISDRITLSIGAATVVPSGEHTQYDLIDRADRLMYEAKQAGRNQCRTAETIG